MARRDEASNRQLKYWFDHLPSQTSANLNELHANFLSAARG